MIREDYRRALIMLRSLKRGVAGHVRLERRTLFATLQFTVTGTGDAPLQGFALGQANGAWRGAVLGALGTPRHGQAGLTARFDPRNLQGLPLEQYSLLGVAVQMPDGFQPILIGNLNGSVRCSIDCIRAECARLFTGTQDTPPALDASPAQSSPEPDELDSPAQDASPAQPSPEPDELDSPAQDVSPTQPSPEPDELDSPAQDASPAQSSPEPDELDSPAQDVSPAQDAPPDSPVDFSALSWPEALDDLRAFFLREPLDHSLTYSGYSFVRAGLACAGNADYCLVGVRVQEGRIQSVCYAVPAAEGEIEPPAGLEAYRRAGNYWLLCQPVEEFASGD